MPVARGLSQGRAVPSGVPLLSVPTDAFPPPRPLPRGSPSLPSVLGPGRVWAHAAPDASAHPRGAERHPRSPRRAWRPSQAGTPGAREGETWLRVAGQRLAGPGRSPRARPQVHKRAVTTVVNHARAVYGLPVWSPHCLHPSFPLVQLLKSTDGPRVTPPAGAGRRAHAPAGGPHGPPQSRPWTRGHATAPHGPVLLPRAAVQDGLREATAPGGGGRQLPAAGQRVPARSPLPLRLVPELRLHVPHLPRQRRVLPHPDRTGRSETALPDPEGPGLQVQEARTRAGGSPPAAHPKEPEAPGAGRQPRRLYRRLCGSPALRTRTPWVTSPQQPCPSGWPRPPPAPARGTATCPGCHPPWP